MLYISLEQPFILVQTKPIMGIFSRNNDLKLSSRTDTTISVTVPPKVQDFSSIAPIAHTLTVDQLLDDFGTSRNDGLSKNEAARRLQTCGENLLQGKGGVSAFRVLIGQFGMLIINSYDSHSNLLSSQRFNSGAIGSSRFELWCSGFHRGSSHCGSHCSQHHV